MSNAFNIKGRKSASINDLVNTIADRPSDNFSGQKLVGMTFNMPQEWHTNFKITSAKEGITMRALLEKCFEMYLRQKND